jgi:hypothetical protein
MKNSLLAVAFLMSVPAFAQDKIAPPVPPAGNVTLPLDEYNRLLELANKSPRRVESAPLPYTIKRGDLKFRVTNETVMGTVQFEGEIFNKGETKVALTSGMTVLDARQQAKGLPFEQEGGTQTAILAGPAEFSVVLDAGLPLNIETGRASFSLPVPSAGSVRLTLEVPGDHTNVKLSPGLITSRASTNGNTTIEATLVPGQPANIWWATREVVAPVVPREVRFLSSVKTLVSVSEADLRLAVLADINVIQGEPSQFEMDIPTGYEVTGTTGASVDTIGMQDRVLTINVNAPARSHQFLISMEKAISATRAEVPFVSMKNSQREMGEVLVEGVGTMELTATEGGSLKRMDIKETNPYLRSLARSPLQAAFRFHRQLAENPSLALEWTRFPDSSVLAAIAEQAVVTTLVTTEGRSLTEIKLTVKNQVQPFLKVELPRGASIVSADVAGQKVKPVEGADGQRVPLLRPGFRPVDSYEVSFVVMHSGTPFAKKGGSELSLPKMDIPITVLHWEVFLPEQYKVKDFGGDALAANLLPASLQGSPDSATVEHYDGGAAGGAADRIAPLQLLPGQLGGYIVDPSGAVVTNAQVSVTQLDSGNVRSATTDYSGRWFVGNMPSGRVRVTAATPGFRTTVREVLYNANYPTSVSFALLVGSVSESIEVRGKDQENESRQIERDLKKNQAAASNSASINVLNLQRRVAGVLPVQVDVPRAGSSYSFIRPLVLDEETKITFTYKTK